MNKQKLQFWIMLTIAVIFIALLVWLVDWRLVWQQLKTARPLPLIGATLSLLIGQLIYVQRWRILLGSRPPYGKVFNAANAGQMINLILPLRLGEPSRIYLIYQTAGVPITQATSSVLVERWFEQMIRMMTLISAVAVGVNLTISPISIFLVIGLLVAFLGMVIWIINHQQQSLTVGAHWLSLLPGIDQERSVKIMQGLLQGLSGLSSPTRLFTGLGLTIIIWTCFLLYHLLVMQALSLPFSLSQEIALSMAGLALSPPSAPTQPGLYHASILGPLRLLGYPVSELTAWVVILHGLQILMLVPLGVWGLARSRIRFDQVLSSREAQADQKDSMPEHSETSDDHAM